MSLHPDVGCHVCMLVLTVQLAVSIEARCSVVTFGKAHGKLVSCQHLFVRRLTYVTVGAGFFLEIRDTVIDLSRESQTRGIAGFPKTDPSDLDVPSWELRRDPDITGLGT